MSKRLKKKIVELLGLNKLKRAERYIYAHEVLNSIDIKQQLCNRVPGLSFRDIDKAMKGLIDERQPTQEEIEEQEMRRIAPQKLMPENVFTFNKGQSGLSSNNTLTPDDAIKLIMASNEPIEDKPIIYHNNYTTWTAAEVRALIEGNYNPMDFK